MELAHITIKTNNANGKKEAAAIMTTKAHGSCGAVLLVDPEGQEGAPGLSGGFLVTRLRQSMASHQNALWAAGSSKSPVQPAVAH